MVFKSLLFSGQVSVMVVKSLLYGVQVSVTVFRSLLWCSDLYFSSGQTIVVDYSEFEVRRSKLQACQLCYSTRD